MSAEMRMEWDDRARRQGLSSVMSTRWSEEASANATNNLKMKVFGALGNLNGQRLLELGQGIGRFTGDFQKTGAMTVAVDHSIEMLKRARAGNKSVPFILANAAELPLANGEFDIAVAITVLQHITNPEEFQSSLNELKRVTKKRILICDELRLDWSEQVSPFTTLRTVDQFTDGMYGWNLSSKDIFTCVSDEYTLMVWEKTR